MGNEKFNNINYAASKLYNDGYVAFINSISKINVDLLIKTLEYYNKYYKVIFKNGERFETKLMAIRDLTEDGVTVHITFGEDDMMMDRIDIKFNEPMFFKGKIING